MWNGAKIMCHNLAGTGSLWPTWENKHFLHEVWKSITTKPVDRNYLMEWVNDHQLYFCTCIFYFCLIPLVQYLQQWIDKIKLRRQELYIIMWLRSGRMLSFNHCSHTSPNVLSTLPIVCVCGNTTRQKGITDSPPSEQVHAAQGACRLLSSVRHRFRYCNKIRFISFTLDRHTTREVTFVLLEMKSGKLCFCTPGVVVINNLFLCQHMNGTRHYSR